MPENKPRRGEEAAVAPKSAFVLRSSASPPPRWLENASDAFVFHEFDSFKTLHNAMFTDQPDFVILAGSAEAQNEGRAVHLVESVRAISDCGIVLQGEYPIGGRLPGNCDAVLPPNAGTDGLIAAADSAIRQARSRTVGANDRAFVQSLLDSNQTLMLSIDGDTRVREFNRACEIITGRSLGEVYGTPLTEIVSSGLEDLQDNLTRNRGRIFPTNITIKIPDIDGDVHTISCSLSPFFDELGSVRLVVITGVDITEHRQTEGALRQSEEAFRTLVESSPDSVCVFSRYDRRWLYANPAALQTLGASSYEQLIEHDIMSLIAPQDRDSSRERLNEIARTGKPQQPEEIRLIRLDGRTAWVETVEIPLRYKGVSAILTISRDQTERKELTARMMQLDRMVAVGTLAAGVGHEINNPLAYLTSNIEYATEELKRCIEEDDARPLEEVIIALDEALDGALRVKDIVRDLKDLSRAESDRAEPIDIESVVESAINIASHEIRTRATVRRDFESVPLVNGSGSRVRQLLVNILLNAAQAMEPGSPSRKELLISIRSPGPDRVTVTVRDQGSGITKEELKRVFDPFFTTKPVGAGTGLGLTISQRIIESLGGSLSIESEPGKGTTVHIDFEAITSEAFDESDHPSPSRQVPIRILLLDDEPMIGTSVQRALSQSSDVILFETGAAALEHLQDDQDFDAILCDIVMPGMSGEEFYNAAIEAYPELEPRFVFMTGGAFTDEAASFQKGQRARVLEKPFATWELRELLYKVASG